MSTTDIDQLHDIAWRVIEPDDLSFSSGLWSKDEIANYYTQRASRFNRDAKVILAHQGLAFTANQVSAALPQDWIASLNGSWTPYVSLSPPNFAPSGPATTVAIGDRYAAEKGISATNNPPSRPILMDDSSAGPLTLELFPPPTNPGILDLLYASSFDALAFDLNSPDIFELPDEFMPYVLYGVLADMLSKDGRGQDLARAAYCERRFAEGIALAGVLLAGYF